MFPPSTSTTLSVEQLTAVPFSETAAVLRYLIRDVVMVILRTDMPVSMPPPNLVDILQRQPLDKLWQKITADPNTRVAMQRRGLPSAKQDGRGTNQTFFLNQAAASIEGKLTPESALKTMLETKREALNLSWYELVPSAYWPFVIQSAWEDLNFQFELAAFVRRTLRGRVLFEANDSHCPVFSSNTLWALILLLKHPGGPGKPAAYPLEWLQEAAISLREVALQQIGSSGWAGFWDQWLICEALRVWKPVPEKNLAPFFRSLLDLPFVKEKLKDRMQEYLQPEILKITPPWRFGRSFLPDERPKWDKHTFQPDS